LLIVKLITFVECEWFLLWLQATLLSGSMYFVSCVGFTLITGLLAGFLFGSFHHKRFVIAGLCILAMAVGVLFQRTQVERFLNPAQAQFSINSTLKKRAILSGFGMGEWFNTVPVDRELGAYLRNMTVESMFCFDVAIRFGGRTLPEFCQKFPSRECAMNLQQEILNIASLSTTGLSFFSSIVDLISEKEFTQKSDEKNVCLDLEKNAMTLGLEIGWIRGAQKWLASLSATDSHSVIGGLGSASLSQGGFPRELEKLLVMRFLAQQLSLGESLLKMKPSTDSKFACANAWMAWEKMSDEFLTLSKEFPVTGEWEKQTEGIAIKVDALKNEWRRRGLWLRIEEILLPESAHQSYSRFSL